MILSPVALAELLALLGAAEAECEASSSPSAPEVAERCREMCEALSAAEVAA